MANDDPQISKKERSLLKRAKEASERGHTIHTVRGEFFIARLLVVRGLLREAGFSVSSGILYVITPAGRTALSSTERTAAP